MRPAHMAALLSIALWPAAPGAKDRSGAKGSEQRAIQKLVRRALSAGPASIAKGAAVVRMDDHGGVVELRPGSNGWTCFPEDPGTPTRHPVCVDRNGLAWFQAAMAGREPDPNLVGYSYMLQGGSTWSVLDPSATKLPEGQKAPVTIPPHIMILNAKLARESGFPRGEAQPDTRAPFVVYGDTPWAILIIPVS